jgi:hypothetical protein
MRFADLSKLLARALPSPKHDMTNSLMPETRTSDDNELHLDGDSDVSLEEDSDDEEMEQARCNVSGAVLEIHDSISMKPSELLDLLSDEPKTDILRPGPASADAGSLSVTDAESRVFELQEPLRW